MNKLIIFILAIFLLGACTPMNDPGAAIDETTLPTNTIESGNMEKATDTASNFIHEIQAQNYTALFNLVSLPSNSLVTEDDVAWFLKRSDYADLTGVSFTISSVNLSGTSRNKLAHVVIGKDTYQIKLELDLNNEWKVVLDQLTINDWQLKVPKDSELVINLAAADAYKAETIEDYDLYVFPAIPNRELEITVNTEHFGSFTQTLQPTVSAEPFIFICRLNEDVTNEALLYIKDTWNGLYLDYAAGTDVPGISKYFSSDFDVNEQSNILLRYFPALAVSSYDPETSYFNFSLANIKPWEKDNYGAAILNASNTIIVNFGYTLEFVASDGGYHSVRRISSITLLYDSGQYMIQRINDPEFFSYNNYSENDF